MTEHITVEFTGTKPTRGSTGAAAVDLYAAEDAIILPGEVVKVRTGTKVAIPEGHVGILAVRSSLGAKGIMLGNGIGVIDSDYRGELILALYNGNIRAFLFALSIGSVDLTFSDGELYKPSVIGSFKFSKGDRIGQLFIQKVPENSYVEVETLSATERGEGGFGSTGLK